MEIIGIYLGSSSTEEDPVHLQLLNPNLAIFTAEELHAADVGGINCVLAIEVGAYRKWFLAADDKLPIPPDQGTFLEVNNLSSSFVLGEGLRT